MVMRRELYPDNWEEISAHIRFTRAQGKCEQCGAKHDTLIIRSVEDAYRYVTCDLDSDEYIYMDGRKDGYLAEEFDANLKYTKVVLTVHHIDFDKSNNLESNLIALCQRCHLVADSSLHVANAKQTRLDKKRQQTLNDGQMELF